MTLLARAAHLDGRYRREALLGRGGMADVYVAHDELLDRRVALKVLRDASSTERLQAEARTLARLNHPGLVTVLDAGAADGRPFLVLELVEGVTLADCCTGEALAPGRVAAIGVELAETLDYVHRNGVIHRDVKPGNVLLSRDGRVLLADFGVARLVEGSSATETGLTLGTAAYLSPEQVRGEPLTPAVDVYSLGLVLLESLTGERAYAGPAVEAAVARLQREPEVPDHLPAGWVELLRDMTVLDPAARPMATEVADRLRALTDGRPVVEIAEALQVATPQTRLLSLPPSAPRARRRSRRLLPLVLAVSLVAGLAAVFVLRAPATEPVPSQVRVPTGVPSGVAEDLRELHDAVWGAP